MTNPQTLTDDQAAVYDRQLRVWGHEVQHRLTAAKVLIIGGDGLAAEVAKNLVLAGVGHVTMADDTVCTEAQYGNFLVTVEAHKPATVAEASVHTLSAMNPLISCQAKRLGIARNDQQQHTYSGLQQLTADQVKEYDLVLSCCGLDVAAADHLEAICAESGVMLYIAQVVGSCAAAFINLGPSYTYTDKQKPGESAAPQARQVSYPRLMQALSKPVNQSLGRRPIHPLYQVLRAVRKFEEAHKRPPAGEADLEAVQGVAAALESAEGAQPNSINRPLLEAWVIDQQQPNLGTAPACAVAGGVIANSILRAVSKVGAPLKNWFFFSIHDGQGVVEDIAGNANI